MVEEFQDTSKIDQIVLTIIGVELTKGYKSDESNNSNNESIEGTKLEQNQKAEMNMSKNVREQSTQNVREEN